MMDVWHCRFRSAFEYQRNLVATDVSQFSLDPSKNPVLKSTHYICILGPTCLAPYHLTKKARNKDHVLYSKKMDAKFMLFSDVSWPPGGQGSLAYLPVTLIPPEV